MIETDVIYTAETYYNSLLNGKKVICVDFDNTVCLDEWPYIGPLIPESIRVLKELQSNGHKLIFYTQRTRNYPICCDILEEFVRKNPDKITYRYEGVFPIKTVDIYSDAIKVLVDNDINIWDENRNFKWENLTNDFSRKLFADYFIDDHNVGMKYVIIRNKFGEECKVCDWNYIDDYFVSEGLYKNKVL